MAAFSPHASIELESFGPSRRNETSSKNEDLKAQGPARISATRHSTSSQRADVRFPNSASVESPSNEADRAPLHIQMKWNEPRINMARLPLLFFDFLVFGMNDGAYGALIPALESYYGLSYTIVSLIFLTPFAGYTLAAFLSSPLHVWAGQRGIALITPICRLITYVVMATHPPYPVVVFILSLAGIGNGLTDAAWNAYLGDMESANEVLGIMHAFYGLGATISPLLITAMTQAYGLPWWTYYYILIGLTILDALAGTGVFWTESGKEFRRRNIGSEADDKGRTRQALRNKITWICAAFLFFYTGTEVGVGGWIISFMTTVRHGGAYQSGLTATGFWLGIAVGRVTLGFVTPKIGERLAVSIYLVLAIVLQLIFWLVPNFIVSAVVVAFQGYFLAPLWPATVVAAAKLLPKKLHVSSIGISSALGGAGAAILPFATGAIVNVKGVSTLQPIILAFMVCQFGIWNLLPKFPRNTHDD